MLLDSEGWNILGYSLHYLHRKPLLVALPALTAIAGSITCIYSCYWLHYLHLQLLLVALPVPTAVTGCIVSHTLWENKLAVCIES